MIRSVVVVLSLLLFMSGSATLWSQSIEEISKRSDKRTLRERAAAIANTQGSDSLEMHLLEQWLSAVPTDTEAAARLSVLYQRSGRAREAAAAQVLSRKKPDTNHRELTMHTLQVRMGTYKVLLPSVMKPAQTFPAVLVLHGNGHTPEFMMQWIQGMNIDSVIFLFPEAPYPKYSEILATHRIKLSASGEGIGLPDSLMSEITKASAAWYHDVLTDASARLPISKVKPIVVGFSQGGFYSYVVAVRYPFTFGGVVSICASMYEYGQVLEHLDDFRTHGVNVLITHSRQDNVVPFQTAELIRSALVRNHVDHEFLPFDGGHWPTHDVSRRISDWIRQHLR